MRQSDALLLHIGIYGLENNFYCTKCIKKLYGFHLRFNLTAVISHLRFSCVEVFLLATGVKLLKFPVDQTEKRDGERDFLQNITKR